MITVWAFWGAIALIVYVLTGYPALVWCLGMLRPRLVRRAPITPSVTILIPAHNEAALIDSKIRNCLAVAYPKDRLDIVVASDGSTDSTNEIVQRYATDGVRLLAYPHRRGKMATLNAAFPLAKGEIVILSDVSGLFDSQAVRLLVRNFADLQVGCVSGTYRFGRPPSSVRSAGEQHYFRYETAIREWESRWHSTLGAHGAGYAIRSVLFPSIPRTIINDDFVIPAKIIAAGYRAVYEKEAIVYEQTEATITQEFSRRVRIAAGNFQQLALLPELLRRRCFSAAFAFFSHKVLRTLLPFLLLICFVASWLIEGQFYRTAALFQLAFYSMGLLGALRQGVPRLRRWLTVPSYFVLGNLASVVGFYNFCRHPHHIDWGGRRDRDS